MWQFVTCVLLISTAGGRFGRSSSDDPEDKRKLRRASVTWDFTQYATLDYIDQPLRTSGSIVFPDRIELESGRYELRYLTTWGVPSAETALYIDRPDLLAAFETAR